LWGRAMRQSGFIPIDRGNRQRAIGSLNTASEHLAQGTYIWIAPEGTRSRTGQLGPLKKGGFIMATAAGVPILPITIQCSARITPPQGWRLYRDSTTTLVFKPPIATAGRSIDDLMAEVKNALDCPAPIPTK